MALEIVADGENDKTKKNYWVHDQKTWDGICVLFCVAPSFITDHR